MTRVWSFHRLVDPAPDRDLYSRLADAVRLVRAADPGALWSFTRLSDGLRVTFGSAADVDGSLRSVLTGCRTVMAGRSEPPARSYPDADAARLADEMSTVSSDLALAALCAGAPTRCVAVWHLGDVVERIPEAGRGEFLFHCWRYWADALSPRQRVSLVAEADRWRADTADGDADRTPWQPYADRVGDLVEAAGQHARFLLFDHAQQTHHRLGLDLVTAALTAWVVRSVPSRVLRAA